MSNDLFPKSAPRGGDPEPRATKDNPFPKSARPTDPPAERPTDPVAAKLFPKSALEVRSQAPESPSEPPKKSKPSRDEKAARVFPGMAASEEAEEQAEADDQADREAAAELRPITPLSLVEAAKDLEGFEFSVDEEAAEQASEILADLDLDLSAGQQSTLVRAAATHVARIREQDRSERWTAVEDTWAEWDSIMSSSEGKADASLAKQILGEFSQGDLREWLTDTGFSKHPGLVRTLAAIQRELAQLRRSRS